MLLEAVLRLEHGCVRELRVYRRDTRVRAVVEPAIRPDRPVHAMHQPAVLAREAAKPCEVEVERVEEAGRRAAGDPVVLDGEPADLELPDESAKELVPTAGGWRLEVVEQREVGACHAGSDASPPPSAAVLHPRGSPVAPTEGARGHPRATR